MLVVLLSEQRGPLAADMRRFYGCNLTDVLAGRVASLTDVAAWAANLPPGGAVHRARNPDGGWQHDARLELERAQLWEMQKVAFFTGKRAGHRMDPPEPLRFPWEPEPDDGSIKGDAMTMDEAADFLGWPTPQDLQQQGTED